MKIYTVHLAPADKLPAPFADVALAPESFSWAAFIFGPFWLLAHRLWAWAGVWVVAALAYGLIAHFFGGWIAEPGLFVGALLAEILLGFEAHNLRRGALERSGCAAVDVVCAQGEDDAASGFFRRRAAAAGNQAPTGPRTTPPPLPSEKGFLSMFPDERAP